MGGVQWAIASNYKTQDGALGLGFDWSLVYQAAVWCPTLNVYSPCGPSVLALRNIHEQISAFATGVSIKMSNEIPFQHIAGPTLSDPPDLL